MKMGLSRPRGLLALAILAVFGLMGLAGCGGPEPTYIISPTATFAPLPTATRQEIDLSFETIERRDFGAKFYDSEQPRLAIVAQPTDIEPLQDIISVDAQASLRELDFNHEFAISVFRGPTGIFYPKSGVEVQRIIRQGNIITVFAIFHGPFQGYEMIPVENSPYHVITLDRDESMHGEFSFILTVDGTVKAQQMYRFP